MGGKRGTVTGMGGRRSRYGEPMGAEGAVPIRDSFEENKQIDI